MSKVREVQMTNCKKRIGTHTDTHTFILSPRIGGVRAKMYMYGYPSCIPEKSKWQSVKKKF